MKPFFFCSLIEVMVKHVVVSIILMKLSLQIKPKTRQMNNLVEIELISTKHLEFESKEKQQTKL